MLLRRNTLGVVGFRQVRTMREEGQFRGGFPPIRETIIKKRTSVSSTHGARLSGFVLVSLYLRGTFHLKHR